MACRAAALALLLSLALVIGGPAVSVAADGAASDITLKDVSVSVLEASGSASSTHQVSSPTAGLKVVLDHTRTVKVRTADWPPPRCLAAAPGWSGGICLQLLPACHSQGSSALGRLAILP